MKKTLLMLLVAGISLASCTKQHSASPSGTIGSAAVTDADFTDSKARVLSGQLKTADEGVTIDYDFFIKEVATDKYLSAIRLNSIRLNGNKINGVKFNGSQSVYKAIVIGVNTTKEEKEVPIVLLDGDKADKTGDIIVFDPFTSKEDLVNDVVDVTMKLTIGGGSVVIGNSSTVTIGGSNINIKENTNIVINGGNLIINDNASFFVTKSGMTVEQNPRISIVKLRKSTLQGQTYGKIIVIVDNDPNDEVASLTYEPAPIALDPNKPDVLTKLPIMEFKETHYNKQQGLHRYESTKTWDDVYGKYGLKPILGKEGFRIKTIR